MRFLPLAVSLFIFGVLFPAVSAGNEIDLRERILNAHEGEWVRMRATGGIETVTLITRKDPEFMTVEIHTFRKGKPQSWVEQVYRLSDKTIQQCRVKYPDGFVEEIPPGQVSLWIDVFKNKQYRFVETEEVEVPAGTFEASHYRTIVDDRLIHLWLSEAIPVTGLAKSRFHGGSSELIQYGRDGIPSAF